MAYDFGGTNSGWIDTGYSGVSGTGARTFACAFKTTDTGIRTIFGYGGDNGGDSGAAFGVNIENGVVFLRVFNGATSWGSGYNDGAWHYLMMTAPSSATLGDVRVYVDGSDLGLGSGSTAINPRAGSGTYQDASLGWNTRRDTDVSYNGDAAEFAEWGVQLGDAEATMWGKGVSPLLIAPSDLRFHAPLVRSLRDTIGGVSMTDNSTTGPVDHPRIINPAHPIIGVPQAAAPAGGALQPGSLGLLGVGI